MNPAAAAGFGVALLLLFLFFRWKWTAQPGQEREPECPPCTAPVQLVHRLCPHHNVVQSFEVEQKDSLDEHLDVLTRKLAEKEGRLLISKSKIRETQHEIDKMHAIDADVKNKYKEIMESLRTDLLSNEKECKKIQEQIEWVSRRRAELRDEMHKFESVNREAMKHIHSKLIRNLETVDHINKVRVGQKRYSEAAARLAGNLAELQRGRGVDHSRVTAKPQEQHSQACLRHRHQPHMPTDSSLRSLVIKSPLGSEEAVISSIHPSTP